MSAGTGDPVWLCDQPTSELAVICALRLESRIPIDALSRNCPQVIVSGPGPDNAYRAARDAIASGAKALISFGIAGGLSLPATTGTVLLPQALVCDAGRWEPSANWLARLREALNAQFTIADGPLYSAQQVLTDPTQKRALASSTGCVAVDMESAAVAKAAAESQLAFVALRVVADGPDDALPDGIERLVTASGRTRLIGLPRMLLPPRRFRLLLQLGAHSRIARDVLRRAVQSLAATTKQ